MRLYERRPWLLAAALTVALLCLIFAAPAKQPARMPEAWDGGAAALGLLLQEDEEGLYVLAVWDGSSAQRAGLEPGDRLLQVNGSALMTLAELEPLLTACLPDAGVTFLAQRNGSQRVTAVISPP